MMESVSYIKLLLLGGTAEAYDLAGQLNNFPNLQVINSLAGRTERPKTPVGQVRIGGFGGPSGLQQYLFQHQINLIIDATHPFATKIQCHAQQAASNLQIPLLRFERRLWQADLADRWIMVDNYEAAIAQLKKQSGKRIFLTIGSQMLPLFYHLSDFFFLVRLVNALPSFSQPPENFQFIYSRGPFDQLQEVDLLMKNNIEVLVSKNSGGLHTYAKILAARQLNLPIIMIKLPRKSSEGLEKVTAVAEALEWTKKQMTFLRTKTY